MYSWYSKHPNNYQCKNLFIPYLFTVNIVQKSLKDTHTAPGFPWMPKWIPQWIRLTWKTGIAGWGPWEAHGILITHRKPKPFMMDSHSFRTCSEPGDKISTSRNVLRFTTSTSPSVKVTWMQGLSAWHVRLRTQVSTWDSHFELQFQGSSLQFGVSVFQETNQP